jgi:protein-tyrosine phosphatase
MVDIHCHVLPDVDDGPRRIKDSLDMLRNALKTGVKSVVATPHLIENTFNIDVAGRNHLIHELQSMAKKNGINIQIKGGYECYISPEIFEQKARLIELTLNTNGKYILVELPMHSIPLYIEKTLISLKDRGVIPVIAHPERNIVISKNPNVLLNFLSKGCVAQLNAGSILGYYGRAIRDTARKLLLHNLVHLVASDMHSTTSPMMAQALPAISALIGNDRALYMFNVVPHRIVMGEDFDRYEPLPYEPKRRSFRDILFGKNSRVMSNQ